MRSFRRNYSFRVYRLPKRFFKRLLAFTLILAFFAAGSLLKGVTLKDIATFATSNNLGVINVADHNLQEVLDSSIPMISLSNKDNSEDLSERLLTGALLNITGIQLGKPFTFLQAEIPYLRNVAYQVATAEPEEPEIPSPEPADSVDEDEVVGEEEPVEEEKEEPIALDPNKPLIAIYHTHIGESYALSDGTVRKAGGRGGVYEAGKELKRVLEEKHGISVIHSDKIHDYDYTSVLPYSESGKTLTKLLKDYPSIEIVIDLHRDAVPIGWTRQQSVTEINGKKYATMFLVVGTDRRQAHPDWRQNSEFAKRISAKAQEMYPGLLRKGAQEQDGRYNQHLHPRAILVEIGEANYNHTEEAIATAGLLADILAEVIKEIQE